MAKVAARLFNSFQPLHYDLAITPDGDKMVFSGTVTIRGKKVGRPTKRLVFHQKDLTITKATLVKLGKGGPQPVEVSRINCQRSLDEVRLHSDESLLPAEYEATLSFEGKITRDMLGIYPSFFKHGGKEKAIISTQFESHHAREAFPCIDEPEAKATFDLHLTTPNDVVALSNMPILTEKAAGKGLKETTFKTSPRMSCYLLAFAFGEMHCQEGKSKDGVLIRSWSSVAQPKELLTYSVKEAIQILEFFTDYFGVPFPLEKCDQLALPDFDAGAMENWGLITFREVVLLADPKNRSISTEQFVSLVVAHEMSHQWFGNLVTMQWWDDLWLNESFAAIMEHLAPSHIHPDWNQWEMYSSSDILATTSRDIYSGIQAISVKVTDPELIETLFDPTIVYAKGGRLIKMMREYIGDKALSKGLQAYFKKHAYGNTTRHDLWKALEASSGKDIDALMTPWIDQSGMPVLHIEQTGKDIQLSQERFTLDETHDKHVWPIPLLSSQPLDIDVLAKRTGTATAKTKDYVVFNEYGSGHYICDYRLPAHRQAIVEQIKRQELPTEARINLLNDSILLARHGDHSLTDTLDIIAACSAEDRDSVWALIAQTINYSRILTDGDSLAEEQIKTLRRQVAREQYKKLGWHDKPTDDPNTKQLRHSIVSMMVGGEDKEAIAEALKLYKASKSLTDIPAELRNTILAAAVKHGEAAVVDRLIKEYPAASPELQQDITSALAATKDPKTAKHIMGKALGPKGFVRPQDILRWQVLFLRNPYTRDVAWDFLEANWDWLWKTLGNSKSTDFIPTYCASVVNSEALTQRYKKFFEPKRTIKVLEHNIKLGYADIEARLNWRQRDEAAIKQWLKSNT